MRLWSRAEEFTNSTATWTVVSGQPPLMHEPRHDKRLAGDHSDDHHHGGGGDDHHQHEYDGCN
jgi:hypothetical protein